MYLAPKVNNYHGGAEKWIQLRPLGKRHSLILLRRSYVIGREGAYRRYTHLSLSAFVMDCPRH